MATRPEIRTDEHTGARPRRRSLTFWAWALAEQYLARDMPRRWAHVQGVARIGSVVGREILPAHDLELLVAAGLLHDIGYAPPLVDSGYHPLDGARFLAAHDTSRLACLVANHSAAAVVAGFRGLGDELAAFPDECTALRDTLWYSDLRTSPVGEPIAFDDRIADIQRRHGPDSVLVRALNAGALDARRDAVRRTELRLAEALTARSRV